MLIYHAFPDRLAAERFASDVEAKHPGLSTVVCDTQEEANAIDVFPFPLVPPIALVTRRDPEKEEREIEELCQQLGGEFAGT